MLFGSVVAGLLSVAGLASAMPRRGPHRDPHSHRGESGPGSCHGPSNRACWCDGFDIHTDYELDVPYTGETKHFDLELTEVNDWTETDGQPKEVAMLINGQFPGPLIEANWGDEIEVTVTNNLASNGSSIHWHGIRMLNNNINDGVNGITECPIPPGSSKTYKFLAQQYGTSWYHSHYSTQYANGVLGPLVIHGPASLPYDIDLGVLSITDWYYAEAEATAAYVQKALDLGGAGGAPPLSDNILFNGKAIGPNGTGGEYSRMTLTPGKRHRLRLVNPSVDNSYTLTLVDHDMTIIQSDFVPVNSYTTNSVFLPVGARLDVTIDASKDVDHYWFNATLDSSGACGVSKVAYPAMIFSYDGVDDPEGLPSKEGTPPESKRCEDTTDLVPVVTRTASLEGFDPVDVIDVALGANASHIYWNISGHPMNVLWEKPSLEYVKNHEEFEPDRNVLRIQDDPEWTVWVIQNELGVPHPMHLHGHDFLVLGRSPAYENPFSTDTEVRRFDLAQDQHSLKLENPTRRDVTMLPGKGWLVLAFRTDNPGAWVMHCHIAWHVGQGLSVQYLERESEIPEVMDLGVLEENCANWKAYPHPYPKIDSGLKAMRG